MSIESRSRQYGKIAGHWQIREFLGSGSGGKSAVFRLVHTDSDSVESTLKVVNLIEKRGNFESLSESRKAEYERAKHESKEFAEQEVLLMNKLQGRTNVVAYSDHTFVDWADETGFGCDMLIRMELLSDLRSEIEASRKFDQDEIVKIGRDICTALVLCHKKNILHRDIKPENIFYNEDGNYKLGDFGVSRILSAAPTSSASTNVCTPEYAAPEQLFGKYDKRVDIYSLGLVLYELSNNNLLPFATSSYITGNEVQMRTLGTSLPAPCNASKALASVILKACAFRPEDRYQTAETFLQELNALVGIVPTPVPKYSPANRDTQKAVSTTGRNETQYANSDAVKQVNSKETVYAYSEYRKQAPKPQQTKSGKRLRVGHIVGIAMIFAIVLCLYCLYPLMRHEHIWLEATCTAPRTCEKCGAVEGTALGHRWADATCETPKTCKICNETVGSALGHQWIEATYESPKTCSICRKIEGEVLAQPWTYINELSHIDNYGRVWKMCAESPNHVADSDINDSNSYLDYTTIGYVTGPVCDHLGNTYTYGLCVDGLDYSEYSITYYIDEQYTTFSGYISMTVDVQADSAAATGKYFEVYGDGVLLGRSPTMTNKLPQQSFSIDVTGVKVLTIQYPKTSGPSRMAMIFDGKLS